MKIILSVTALLIASWFSQLAVANPQMSLEEPAENAIYTGVSNIRGWAVSEDGITGITLFIDGQQVSDIPSGGTRNDVARSFSAIVDADQSGFSMAFNFSELDAGPHVMRVVAMDGINTQTEIVRNFTSVRFDSAFITSAIDLGNVTVDSSSTALIVENLEIDGISYDLELEWRKSTQGFAIRNITFSSLDLVNFATFNTNFGNFVIELNPEESPITVANFKDYVSSNFYNNTLIHRIVKDLLIQGGGTDLLGVFKVNNAPIINEAGNGLKNLRGTIAMARQTDPHSARSQFYINLQDSPSLDHVDNTDLGYGYAVFGKVVSGMDIVDEIGRNPGAEVIVNTVILSPSEP